MELEATQLEAMADEFEAKAQNLRAEAETLQNQAEKAEKAAEHIRQVVSILNPEEQDAPPKPQLIAAKKKQKKQTNIPVAGKLSQSVIKTIFETGGCHLNTIIDNAVENSIGTKFSTPKTVHKLRKRGLIHSPERGWYFPNTDITLDDMNFVDS